MLLGGKPAVRVHICYKNDSGLPIERIMVGGGLSFQYEAPAIVYFQRGLADFEAMLGSVQFR